jgi:hypothetical protein
MSDFGPNSGTPEYSAGAGVFLDVHTQNNVSTPASSGVPGGLAGPASAVGSPGPGGFSQVPDPAAYGTKSDGSAVTPVFIQSFTGGNGSNVAQGLFSFKNPA